MCSCSVFVTFLCWWDGEIVLVFDGFWVNSCWCFSSFVLLRSSFLIANKAACFLRHTLHRIGWRENFNRKPLYLMVKTMVSCRFSLKPIHWTLAIKGARPLSGHVACRNGTLWRKNLEELVVNGFTLKMWYPNIWRNSSSLKSPKKTCHVASCWFLFSCWTNPFSHHLTRKKSVAPSARGGTTLRRSFSNDDLEDDLN